jgi:hypothetical protein
MPLCSHKRSGGVITGKIPTPYFAHILSTDLLCLSKQTDSFPLHGIKWLVILMQAELSSEWRERNSQSDYQRAANESMWVLRSVSPCHCQSSAAAYHILFTNSVYFTYQTASLNKTDTYTHLRRAHVLYSRP